MIKKIHIKNFRSIINQDIELRPLTVIVGANNTGKSNLIKCLDFLGNLSRKGLRESIKDKDGFNNILPKIYDEKKLKGKKTEIDVNFKSEPYKFENEKERELWCNYSIEFGLEANERIKVEKEITKVFDILGVTSRLNKSVKKYNRKSEIIIEIAKNKIGISSNPGLTSRNIDLFYNWMLPGPILDSVDSIKKSSSTHKKILAPLIGYTLLKSRGKVSTMMAENLTPDNLYELAAKADEDYDSIFGTILSEISPHFLRIRSALTNINRYDFLINILRKEQNISQDKILKLTGDNLTSVLQSVSKENKEAWNRILDTLSNISPMINDIQTKKFLREKLYIEFEEIFGGRPIESWEASDGTLRVLAILTAIESQKPYATVLIEEPEIGLHPWALKHLIEHMKELIEKNNIQIIITTHSDQILENVKMDEVLVCSRNEKEGTVFKTLKEISPNSNEDMNSIGRKWRQGLIGGVPECV